MNPLILLTAAAGSAALEPVIVTATRTESPANEVLASVDILAGDELLRQPAAELSDSLRFMPGVEPARLGGPGQQTSLFVRGTESNHVLVLMDGLRINPGTVGTAAIQNIAPEFVERVEIVKGPRSTLYGSDAIGGVMNVITRGVGESGSAQAGYGSFDTKTASFSAGFGDDDAGATLAGAWLDSEGFPTREGDNTDRGTENTSFTASAHAGVGAVDVGVRGWYASGTTQYSDFFLAPLDQDFENIALSVTAGIAPTESWTSRLMLGHAEDNLEQNQSDDFLDTARNTVDWQNDVRLSDTNLLTAGLLWQDEEADAVSFVIDAYGADTTTTQVYVQDQADLGPHRLLLGAAYTDHETFGGHETWNAEYGYAFAGGALATLSAGTAFRAPDATDLYSLFGGNPDLQPEESESYELGYRQPLGERQLVSVAAFRNDIHDLITFVPTGPFTGENQNVDRARIDGVELSWQYEDEDWSARAAATFQDPRDETTDERLLRRARENYTAALARRFGGHELSLDVLYAGERRDFDAIDFAGLVKLDAYWLANLSANIALGERFTLYGRIENLLDEEYQLAHTFRTMGRSYFGAIRYEFR
ncbi:MAG TPA: TonB-dependent receptor [Steroidobacteraceae bacterium]|nr:TonB-dependent receptor [Steroidobacteraceae bacterium]